MIAKLKIPRIMKMEYCAFCHRRTEHIKGKGSMICKRCAKMSRRYI